MEFIIYLASDKNMWVNITVFMVIVIFACHGGGFVSGVMMVFYASYIAVDAFYLWQEFNYSWLYAEAKFNSIMYMAVSIVCLMAMLLFFTNAILRGHQALVSFIVAAYIGAYYLLPNLMQAGVIEYTTGLIPLYEYVYEYSVFIDILFVIAGWLSLRGGDEMAHPDRNLY